MNSPEYQSDNTLARKSTLLTVTDLHKTFTCIKASLYDLAVTTALTAVELM
jgi:hypothetical protein